MTVALGREDRNGRCREPSDVSPTVARGPLASFEQFADEVLMLARLSRDLRGLVRAGPTREEAAATVRTRLETRSDRFLALAERAIYQHPGSPYLHLLRSVGCEPGDLRALVQREGLDGALGKLADLGVYVSFDEFKGRSPIVRGSERFVVEEEAFDNPRLAAHFEVQSGGTRSRGTTVRTSLGFVRDLAVDTLLAFEAHRLGGAEHAAWLTGPVLPLLMYAHLGRPTLAWFYPLEPLHWKVRVGAVYLRAVGFLAGARFPSPRWIDLQEPEGLATWLAGVVADGRQICVTTYASSAVRTAVAAHERGLSLDGVTFITLGEPFTTAKQAAVEAVGARALVRYAFTEAGILGYRCAEPRGPDDLHFFSDCFGLIQRPRRVGEGGPSVDAFLFTSLLPSAPKILLNVESGDHGRLEQRACACLLGGLGLRQHVSEIRSHEKLSGEGMTFVKTHLLRVLEEVLPARCGGTPADYQVLEEEDGNGILRLFLLVSPRLGALDEAEVAQTFLAELGRDGSLVGYMAQMWERAGTLRVRRQAPLATKAGKILPFHLQRAASATTPESTS